MKTQKPISRTFAPHLELPGGVDLVLYVSGAEQAPNGALLSQITVWNGTPLYGDTVELTAADRRESFIAKVVAKHKPTDAAALDAALLDLGGRLPRLIREAPQKDDESLDGAEPGAPKRPSQATLLVDLALQDAELWHTPDGNAYATVKVGGHQETRVVNSRLFREHLAHCYYQKHDASPGSQALQDTINVLAGKGKFDGEEHNVYTRVAELEEDIYLDLADDDWRAIKITPRGWSIETELPIRFRRPRGMVSLPAPVVGGSVSDLRPFLNVKLEDDWRLIIAWLLQAYQAKGPYPILPLNGEQGSAKSTTARVLRELIDPNASPLRAEPRDVRDLMIAATHNWVVALDNVSHVRPDLSDALCRLSTGGGFSTRGLYTDDEEIIFEATRPIILTGIEELATRGDLLDRSIVVALPTIPESQRQTETMFWARFYAARPRILGALLDAVTGALKATPTTTLDSLPRMADFAVRATAAEAALGWVPGTFMQAYTVNRGAANETALEASPVVPPLRALMTDRGHVWQATASVLLQELGQRVDDEVRRRKDWPQNGRALSGRLRRLAPNLRAIGIDLDFDQRKPGSGERYVTIKNRPVDLRHDRHTVTSNLGGCDAKPEGVTQIEDPDNALRHTDQVQRDANDGCDAKKQPHSNEPEMCRLCTTRELLSHELTRGTCTVCESKADGTW